MVKKIPENEIKQKKGLIGIIVGSFLLIIGIIALAVGIYLLFFTSIMGDALQLSKYNLMTSLFVILGIYISSLGLHLLLQKLKKSIRAYIIIIGAIFIIIIATYGYSMAGASPGYQGVWGFITLFLYGFSSIIFSVYLLSSYYKPRKYRVYANVVLMIIILILIILLV